MQQTKCSMQHATCNTDPNKILDATGNKIGCNGEHCNMQQAEPTACNVATCYLSLHHAALLQPATCNTHNGWNAANIMQLTAWQQTALQHAKQKTCNGPPWCRGTARACMSAPCGGSKRRGPRRHKGSAGQCSGFYGGLNRGGRGRWRTPRGNVGDKVGANVGNVVGGLVSPALVGAGVVGARVGAAHASRSRTPRVP
jgi:hypothetical protein